MRKMLGNVSKYVNEDKGITYNLKAMSLDFTQTSLCSVTCLIIWRRKYMFNFTILDSEFHHHSENIKNTDDRRLVLVILKEVLRIIAQHFHPSLYAIRKLHL